VERNYVELFVWYIVFVLSTSMHEAAHALVAKLGGDLTAYRVGQVSLDPRPHMAREPMGMFVFPIISLWLIGWPFGFASAPYDPVWAYRYPRRAAWMSLAGPLANLGLVLLAAVVMKVGLWTGYFSSPEGFRFERVVGGTQRYLSASAGLIVSLFFSLNLILFSLNLIPLPPLDGSGALPLVLSASISRRYLDFVNQPAFRWIGLIVTWNIFGEVFRPVWKVALKTIYPGVEFG